MNATERVEQVRRFIWAEAWRLIRDNERDIREDVQQEGFLAILESPYVSREEDTWIARSAMEGYLRKHRERGYKTTFWQHSTEEITG